MNISQRARDAVGEIYHLIESGQHHFAEGTPLCDIVQRAMDAETEELRHELMVTKASESLNSQYARAFEMERNKFREELDIAVENHAQAIERAEAAEGRIENETAEGALNWMELMLIHCPGAVVRYNEDPDVEDSMGMVPVGFSIRGDGCQGSFCVVDDSLQAVLLRDKSQVAILNAGRASASVAWRAAAEGSADKNRGTKKGEAPNARIRDDAPPTP